MYATSISHTKNCLGVIDGEHLHAQAWVACVGEIEWFRYICVGEKGIVKGGAVPTLFQSARMRRTYGTDFASADAQHQDGVFTSECLFDCLLWKREEESRRAHAPSFDFCHSNSLIVD